MNEELIPSRQRLFEKEVREGGVFNSRNFWGALEINSKEW
jgi:hypothetical protein